MAVAEPPKTTPMGDMVMQAAAYRGALAKAVSLLEQAEYSGYCSEGSDCHRCAWDSDRDILLDKWRHLLR